MNEITWEIIEKAALANPTLEYAVKIIYTNWEGKTGVRRIQPLRIVFESSEWHPEPQWVVRAVDLDKKAIRSFALNNIHYWAPDNGE